jgi:hypothetical protein
VSVFDEITGPAKLSDEARRAEVLVFTDEELEEARRLLLPGHMAHHDTAFESQLRAACDRAERRRRRYRGMR